MVCKKQKGELEHRIKLISKEKCDPNNALKLIKSPEFSMNEELFTFLVKMHKMDNEASFILLSYNVNTFILFISKGISLRLIAFYLLKILFILHSRTLIPLCKIKEACNSLEIIHLLMPKKDNVIYRLVSIIPFRINAERISF